MNDTEVIETAREAILIAIQMGAPILLVGLIVGVTIALVQALTQIQEITLVFVPKILAIFLAMFFFLPGMMKTLVTFMEVLADRMIGIGS
jgi:flagellar biosynthetic protein FliQ